MVDSNYVTYVKVDIVEDIVDSNDIDIVDNYWQYGVCWHCYVNIVDSYNVLTVVQFVYIVDSEDVLTVMEFFDIVM